MILHRLKYTVQMTAALLLLSACQSGADEPEVTYNEMVFATEVSSRAYPVSNSNITSLPFAVFGDMTGTDDSADNNPVKIYDDTEVKYDASVKQWLCEDTRYWFPHFQYSFVALHPAKAACLSDYDYSVSDNQLSFTYKQPDDYKTTSDLLIATHRRNYNEGVTFPVSFTFKHILSNINIAVTYINPAPGTLPLKITGITFKNIPTGARYAVSPASLSPDGIMTYNFAYEPGTLDGWTIHDTGDVEINSSEEYIASIPNDDKRHEVFTENNPLFLLPNPKDDTVMEVKYTVLDDNGGSKEYTDTTVIPKGWMPGRKYLLSLQIKNERTQFSIDVIDWIETKPITTTVPRK